LASQIPEIKIQYRPASQPRPVLPLPALFKTTRRLKVITAKDSEPLALPITLFSNLRA
jgi:hypothetical protein